MAIFGAIPLPSVVSDTGPGGRLFTNYNAISKAGLENRKAELQNQFYPRETEAKIQHLISPNALYGSAAGEQAYLNAIRPIASNNPAASQPNLPQPQQQSPDMFSTIGNALKSVFQGSSGKSSTPNNAINNTPTQQDTGQPNRNAISATPSGDMSPNEQAGGSGSSVNSPNSQPYLDSKGFVNGGRQQELQNPGEYNIWKNNASAQGAKQQKEAEAEVAQSADQFTTAQSLSRNAPIIQKNSEILRDAIAKVPNWVKGPRGGLIPHWATDDPNREVANGAVAQLRNAIAPYVNGGHGAAVNLDVAQTLKPDVTLTKEGMERMIAYGEGVAKRQQEFLPIYNKLKAAGLTAPQLEQAYSQYNTDYPFFDVKTQKPINANKYKEFLSPENIAKFKSGQEVDAPSNKFDVKGFLSQKFDPSNNNDEFWNAVDSYSPEIQQQIRAALPKGKK